MERPARTWNSESEIPVHLRPVCSCTFGEAFGRTHSRWFVGTTMEGILLQTCSASSDCSNDGWDCQSAWGETALDAYAHRQPCLRGFVAHVSHALAHRQCGHASVPQLEDAGAGRMPTASAGACRRSFTETGIFRTPPVGASADTRLAVNANKAEGATMNTGLVVNPTSVAHDDDKMAYPTDSKEREKQTGKAQG